MTQTIINVPAAGAFDPTDIEITDGVDDAFLIRDTGGNEWFKIDTRTGTGSDCINMAYTSGQRVLIGKPASASQGPYSTFQVINQNNDGYAVRIYGDTAYATDNQFSWARDNLKGRWVHPLGGLFESSSSSGSFQFRNSSSADMFVIDDDTNATFTLDDTSGAVFKIVDDDASPRTYFTATENGVVEVDGVKVGLGGGRIDDNVAIGDGAFETTQTSYGNSVACGYEAGKRQTGGYNSAFFGFRAGMGITSGIENTAIGFAAMDGNNGALSTTGGKNTAVGASAARQLVGGNENVGIGYYSLNGVSSGSENVALGANAGDAITTGSGNIAIGHASDCAAAGANQIAIGNGVVESTNNRASIGDSSNVATLDFSSSGNSWSNTSDVRIKENIQDSDLGLAFINSLRPVKHTSKDPAQWPEEIRPAEPSGRTPEQLEAVKDGLIAQEVKAAADALGTSFSGWEQDANGLNRLQYERFVVPLIKAVQELSAQVEELKGDK